MVKDTIIEAVKLSEELANLVDEDYQVHTFKILLRYFLFEKNSHSNHKVLESSNKREGQVFSNGSAISFDTLRKSLQLDIDKLSMVYILSDSGELSVNISHLGEGTDTEKIENLSAIYLLGVTGLSDDIGKHWVKGTKLAEQLKKYGLSTKNASKILKRSKLFDNRGQNRSSEYKIKLSKKQEVINVLKDLIQ